MKEIILEMLQKIESDNDVKILYAIESGSRSWGFASRDSDFDVRFIYVYRPASYLSIEQQPDIIELPVNKVLDINGWDIRKALQLFKKSNPPLLEWLHSPIVYLESGSAVSSLRNLEKEYFSPIHAMYHYLHIAKNQYLDCGKTKQIKLKKYFYMLRPLLACMWIDAFKTTPPMEFAKLMEDIKLDDNIVQEIDQLLIRKTISEESDKEDINPIIMQFISENIGHVEDLLSTMNKCVEPCIDPLNELFRTVLAECWNLKLS